MPAYEPVYRPAFLDCLKKYPDKKQRVENFIQRICAEPYYRSERLTKVKNIDLRGKRSWHLTDNFVVVYIICEECIKDNFKGSYNNCSDCPNEIVKRVIFLAFAKHDDIYSKQWRSGT